MTEITLRQLLSHWQSIANVGDPPDYATTRKALELLNTSIGSYINLVPENIKVPIPADYK